MPTLKEKIVEKLKQKNGLSDRELASETKASFVPAVNNACRDLVRRGVIERRGRSDGILGNFLTKAGRKVQPKPLPVAASETENLSEDQLKHILAKWLEDDGWKVSVAWAKERGLDIEAKRGNERWCIEAKGCGSLQPMRVNYFIGILGETLQRMGDPKARYSIALPDLKQFRGLWDRLPSLAKKRTSISAIFVRADGTVAEVK